MRQENKFLHSPDQGPSTQRPCRSTVRSVVLNALENRSGDPRSSPTSVSWIRSTTRNLHKRLTTFTAWASSTPSQRSWISWCAEPTTELQKRSGTQQFLPTRMCRFWTPQPAPAPSSPTSSTTCRSTVWSTKPPRDARQRGRDSSLLHRQPQRSSTPTRSVTGRYLSSRPLFRGHARQHGWASERAAAWCNGKRLAI